MEEAKQRGDDRPRIIGVLCSEWKFCISFMARIGVIQVYSRQGVEENFPYGL